MEFEDDPQTLQACDSQLEIHVWRLFKDIHVYEIADFVGIIKPRKAKIFFS